MNSLEVFSLGILIISSILMLIILYFGMRYIKSTGFAYPYLVYFIFFFSFYKVIAYYIIPLILGFYSNFQYLQEEKVSLEEQGLLYFIEMLSWITWLVGLALVAKLFKKQVTSISIKNDKINHFSKTALVTLTIAFSLLQVVVAVDQFRLESFSIPIWVEIFKSLIAYAGPPASLLLLVLFIRGWGRLYGLLGAIGTLSILGTMSTRGAVVYSILFVMFSLFITSKNQRKFLLKAFCVGFSIGISFFLLGGLPSISIDRDSLEIQLNIDTDKKGGRSPIEEVEWRLGAASRMSAAFIRMYDRGEGAGLNPIVNSLSGFLPRSINPNKPHPSTLEGSDFYSQGMYLIFREINGYDTFSMVEFSSGAHAYWELGWIGVFVLPLVSGIYIALCAFFFQRLGILSLALMMAVFKPFGYVDPKIWVSEIAMQVYQIILPVSLLVFLYYGIRMIPLLLLKFRVKHIASIFPLTGDPLIKHANGPS